MDIYSAIRSKYYNYINEVNLDEFPYNLKRPIYCSDNYYKLNFDGKKSKMKPKKCINIEDLIQYLHTNKIIIEKSYFRKLVQLFVMSSFPYIECDAVNKFCVKMDLVINSICEYGYDLTIDDYIEYEFIGCPYCNHDIKINDTDIHKIKNMICNNFCNYSIVQRFKNIGIDLNDSDLNILFEINSQLCFCNKITLKYMKNVFSMNMIDPNISHLIGFLTTVKKCDVASCKIIISYFAKNKVYISKFLFYQTLAEKYGNVYTSLYKFAINAKLFYDDIDLDSDGEPEENYEDDSDSDEDDDEDDDTDLDSDVDNDNWSLDEPDEEENNNELDEGSYDDSDEESDDGWSHKEDSDEEINLDDSVKDDSANPYSSFKGKRSNKNKNKNKN